MQVEMYEQAIVSEHQRRITMKDRYKLLQSLIPYPSKGDRSSIVADAIQYIHVLNRRVSELKILVEKQRCEKYKSGMNEDEAMATDFKKFCSLVSKL